MDNINKDEGEMDKDDIQESFNDLYWGNLMPVCDLDATTCLTQGLFRDLLACECFSIAYCMKMCETGKSLDPRTGCDCVDDSVIDELYPDLATDEDKMKAMEEGMAEWEAYMLEL